VKGVNSVNVNLVFDPPWTPARMSDEAKLELNML
jgi:metal-sulfur cluster biosynthetic enzyme